MNSQKIISVAIPRPLDGLFTYRVSNLIAQKIELGGCVRVPFGKSSLDAFVVELPREMDHLPEGLEWESLKEVTEILHDFPPLPSDVMSLCRWAHDYYFAPLGEILACAAPLLHSGVRKLKRSAKKVTRSKPGTRRLEPTPEQLAVIEEFDRLRLIGEGKTALLHGVTGSGKTEVYIELARKVLGEDRGVLVLVPEIALTPQLHQRFEESLGVPVGLWHSAMSSARRRDLNQSLVRGEVRVVVGARSGVFAPIQSLGLIVVDEEHDSTYKQEDRVRYHARDLAVVRGKLTRSLVILGSATPSMETWERVREGRYELGVLKNRVGGAAMPVVEMVDLRSEDQLQSTQAPLTRRCLDRIQETLNLGQQVVVYLNRRGFAAYLLCKDCGKVTECQNCSVSLAVHRSRRQLKCHHCGYSTEIPRVCSGCRGTNLKAMGAGTESLESDLLRLLKGVRIARLDRDLVTSATRLNEILDAFRAGETNLLLGTQMLVKGHDFPNVTLVVVVLADSLFRWPDFRAPERAYQILKQVSGRAGRGEKVGSVLIQTFDVEHPVLQVISHRLSDEDFFGNERNLRQALGYPPFGRIARVRVEGLVQAEVTQASVFLSDALRREFHQERGLEILGPSEAFLEKWNRVFRWDILLKAREVQVLQRALRYSKQIAKGSRKRIQIDVDPYGV